MWASKKHEVDIRRTSWHLIGLLYVRDVYVFSETKRNPSLYIEWFAANCRSKLALQDHFCCCTETKPVVAQGGECSEVKVHARESL